MSIEVLQQKNEVPGRGTMQHPRHGRQEGHVLRQRPVPKPKTQRCDPLIHWGKPQHETAELGGNKQTHPSLPPLPRSWVPEPKLCVEVSSTFLANISRPPTQAQAP
ncbi:hypothetical protein ILYODFUR_010131 [Ilyodon furcidens]|uniref:Uncharacterized protein n=1 Tax=Ilyodon furcidens TaxID=33524 RepID=A0ABV0SMZ4_9TELE